MVLQIWSILAIIWIIGNLHMFPSISWSCLLLSFLLLLRSRQRAPTENVSSGPGYVSSAWFSYRWRQQKWVLWSYSIIVCRYQSIMFVCFYLYVAVVIFIDYSDMDKMMDINNHKCYYLMRLKSSNISYTK